MLINKVRTLYRAAALNIFCMLMLVGTASAQCKYYILLTTDNCSNCYYPLKQLLQRLSSEQPKQKYTLVFPGDRMVEVKQFVKQNFATAQQHLELVSDRALYQKINQQSKLKSLLVGHIQCDQATYYDLSKRADCNRFFMKAGR